MSVGRGRESPTALEVSDNRQHNPFSGSWGEGDRARRPLRSSFAGRGSEEGGERGEMKEEEDDDERKKRSTPLRCLARSLARAGLKIRTFSHRPSASVRRSPFGGGGV